MFWISVYGGTSFICIDHSEQFKSDIASYWSASNEIFWNSNRMVLILNHRLSIPDTSLWLFQLMKELYTSTHYQRVDDIQYFRERMLRPFSLTRLMSKMWTADKSWERFFRYFCLKHYQAGIKIKVIVILAFIPQYHTGNVI